MAAARTMGTRRAMRRRRIRGKRWKRAARREIGQPRNYSTCKTVETVLPNGTSSNSQVLQTDALILISQGVNINQRLREAIFLAGIRLDVYVRHLGTQECVWNWAVVHPKNTQSLDLSQADFFRDYTDNRSWDANISTKTGLTWARAQINSDEFVVMAKGRVRLGPINNGTANANVGDFPASKLFKRYIKIGRNITFVHGDTSTPNEQVFFVCWSADPNANAGFNTSNAPFEYRMRAVCYFRDPKNA